MFAHVNKCVKVEKVEPYCHFADSGLLHLVFPTAAGDFAISDMTPADVHELIGKIWNSLSQVTLVKAQEDAKKLVDAEADKANPI